MKQPELGKKIAELRRAQGLTQEQLVEKCNLNVRTLQRIESGEVVPRSYTIKIIFSALDYNDSSDALPGKFNNDLITRKGAGQFYKNVIQSFNPKTYPMKNLVVLSFTVLGVCVGILLFGMSNKSSTEVKKTDLVGTWQICNRNTGQLDTIYAGQSGVIRYKIITPSKFMNVDIMPSKKIMYTAFRGNFDVNNGIYTESIELTAPNYYPYLGQKNDFKIKIEGDFLYIKGINNPYDEMWKKVKE